MHRAALITQPGSSLHCETPIHRAVCLFTPRFSLVCITPYDP